MHKNDSIEHTLIKHVATEHTHFTTDTQMNCVTSHNDSTNGNAPMNNKHEPAANVATHTLLSLALG